MKCFYHGADLDGHLSGELIKRVYGGCELFPIDYGDAFPWSKIVEGEVVYMVDFSLQPFEWMTTLNELTDLVWIDHHKSAIEAYENSGVQIRGSRRSGDAACELVWRYLHPGEEMPDFVRMLGRYDVWDHRDPRVLPFQFGMRTFETDPVAARRGSKLIWDTMFSMLGRGYLHTLLEFICSKGQVIIEYEALKNAKRMRRESFVTELDGLRLIACPGAGNSQAFDSVWDARQFDAMCGYRMLKDGRYSVSLYSDREDVDVSAVCKRHGGGGHKGAAGFVCGSLPFTVK